MKVKLQDTTRDIRRIGHATAKYTSYIYIFGGFANAQYLSTVSRINIGGYDTNTGDPLWKHPVAWETCHPYRQPYEILKTNMMSPRVGHTVSTFDKSMYIWGGVANFELSLRIWCTHCIGFPRPPVVRKTHLFLVGKPKIQFTSPLKGEVQKTKPKR